MDYLQLVFTRGPQAALSISMVSLTLRSNSLGPEGVRGAARLFKPFDKLRLEILKLFPDEETLRRPLQQLLS